MQGYIFGYDLLRNIGVSFQKDRKDFKSTGSCDLSYKMIVKNSGLIWKRMEKGIGYEN